MTALNVFGSNPAFETTQLTTAINEIEYVPGQLGQMGIFDPKPIRSENFFVERKERANALLPLTPKLGPLYQNQRSDRRAVNFKTYKIGTQETVNASEVAGIREFGTEDGLKSMQRELMNRLVEQRADMEFTKEYMRLAAIQGLFLDPADGSTVYNYFTELGVTPEATVTINFTDQTLNVKEILDNLRVDVVRKSKGAWIPGVTKLHCMCGKDVWHALTSHATVKDTYNNWSAAAQLRDIDLLVDGFEYGGVVFHYYFGSEDETSIAIADDEMKFFPVGGREVFSHVMSPADEYDAFVNTLGQDTYVLRRVDREYEGVSRYVGFDVVSYPLFVCERPYMLRTGVAT